MKSANRLILSTKELGEIPNCHLYQRTRKRQTVTLFSPVKSQRTTIPTALLKQYTAVKTNRRRHCCVLREQKFPKSLMEKYIIQGRPNKKFKVWNTLSRKDMLWGATLLLHYFIYLFFWETKRCNEQIYGIVVYLFVVLWFFSLYLKKKHCIEMKQGFFTF